MSESSRAAPEAGVGNYKGYYSQRPDSSDRLQYFKKDWFANKNCLDIGCNTGHLTFKIAEKLTPRSILGIDVDGTLIARAKARLSHTPVVPAAKISSFAPRAVRLKLDQKVPFPLNVSFKCLDILSDSSSLSCERSYDTVICCSVSKWIHLNSGDEGLIAFFQAMFNILIPGGIAILEYQPWKSYERNKNSSQITKTVFPTIKIRPEDFERILTETIGFSISSRSGTPLAEAKGFNRPIIVLTKPLKSTLSQAPAIPKSVISAGAACHVWRGDDLSVGEQQSPAPVLLQEKECDNREDKYSATTTSRKRKREAESNGGDKEADVGPREEQVDEGKKSKTSKAKKKEKKEKKKNKEKKDTKD